MTTAPAPQQPARPARRISMWRLFDLRRDQQDPELIDQSIRAGARFGGTNLWVLFFAITIASVGLNVNSTAVIIGAMLISPLMGPIVGMGYGAAVADLRLIREASKSLAVSVVLSLVTSMVYYTLSPLDQPQSELLARTTPTLWDVLIAAAGGAAGMVAVTRKSYSNIVPGVAIATALMPPLCTAGFGAAHGRWDMFLGASFLFLINCVFIGASTLAVARLLHLPPRGELDGGARLRGRIVLAIALVAMLAPSIWLGGRFAQDEYFRGRAQRVALAMEADPTTNVLSYDIDPAKRTLQLTLIGGGAEAPVRQRAQALLVREGLSDAHLVFRRAGDTAPEFGQLTDMNQRIVEQMRTVDGQLQSMRGDLGTLRGEVTTLRGTVDAQHQTPEQRVVALLREARALRPEVRALALTRGDTAAADGSAEPTTLVTLDVVRTLRPSEREPLQRWLQARLQDDAVQIIQRVVPRAAPRR